MARPRSLDRDRLLDAAEAVVAQAGAVALTFGKVAEAAQVPKASVQSAFGTKEGLLDALLNRWTEQEKARFARNVGPDPTPQAVIAEHIRSTAIEDHDAISRTATLMAAVAGTGQTVGAMADWYAQRAGDLSASTAEERRRRIAFLAVEGAFLLRHVVGFPMDDQLWREIFDDLLGLVEDSQLSSS
jgi:AcrR family transcriptional regulator